MLCFPTVEDEKGRSYLNVNVGEEILPHVGVVALLVGPRQPHVLVHVERFHILQNRKSEREREMESFSAIES